MTKKYKRGDKFTDVNGKILVVIASEDNYVMARFKGCIPFCDSEKEFTRRVVTMNTMLPNIK